VSSPSDLVVADDPAEATGGNQQQADAVIERANRNGSGTRGGPAVGDWHADDHRCVRHWCTSSGIGRHGKDASRHGLLELGGEVAPALLAAPMLLVAPVTTATRPVSRRGIVSGVAVVSVLVRTSGPESGR
jgi:hypothetical protein